MCQKLVINIPGHKLTLHDWLYHFKEHVSYPLQRRHLYALKQFLDGERNSEGYNYLEDCAQNCFDTCSKKFSGIDEFLF